MWVWPTTAVVILLLIVKTRAYLSSLTEDVNVLKMECGDSVDSLINITYTGDVHAVYSSLNELGCRADRIDVLTFRFIGVNKRPCGMEWIEKLNTLHLKIHVQSIFLVTDDDIYYEVECIYGKQTATRHHIQIIDRSVMIGADEIAHDKETGDTAIPGAAIMVLKILNQQMSHDSSADSSIKVFQSNEKLKFQITMLNPNEEVDVVVTECMFQDSLEAPSFYHRFINNGCGAGRLLRKSDKFTVVSKGSIVESPEIPLASLQGIGPVILKCFVSICMAGSTCVAMCPINGFSDDVFLDNLEGLFVINSESFEVDVKEVAAATVSAPTASESTIQTIKTKPTITQWPTTTSTTSTIPTTTKPMITTLAKQLSDFEDPKTLPYAIVVIVLSFIIVVLLVLIIVLSVKLKRSRTGKGSVHFGDRNKLHLGYKRSKHHSKSHLLQPIFMSPSSSESGSRSGSDDREAQRYVGDSHSRKIPSSRSDSYDRRMSYTEGMRQYAPVRSDFHERLRPESSRSRNYSQSRSRSYMRERNFSPSRPRSDGRTSRPRSDFHEGNSFPNTNINEQGQRTARVYYDDQVAEPRDRRERLQSWEREPRPDYKRADNYRSRWEVMEPIMEELQSSDRVIGDRTKL